MKKMEKLDNNIRGIIILMILFLYILFIPDVVMGISTVENEVEKIVNVEDILIIGQESYFIGQIVEIDINYQDVENLEVYIDIENETYKFLGDVKRNLFFAPQKYGNYQVIITDNVNKEVIAKKSFKVIEESNDRDIKTGTVPFETDKSIYTLNELVTITLNFDLNRDFDMYIESSLGTFRFLGQAESKITFLPQVIGDYKIKIFFRDDNRVYSSEFNVINILEGGPRIDNPIDKSKQKNQTEIDKPSGIIGDYIEIHDKKDNIIKANAEAFDNDNNKISKIRGYEKYNWKMVSLDFPFKKISIDNAKLSEIEKIRVDDVPETVEGINGKRWIEIFALDLSSLNNTNGNITLNAEGTEVYKCKDWNFQSERCNTQWIKKSNTVYGEEYSFRIENQREAYGETGVATVNTRKPIYHPLEKVEMIMVILDKKGFLIDNVRLKLNVIDPSGQKYFYSNEDGTISRIKKGIFQGLFVNTQLEGNYKLHVKAYSEDVNYSMSSNFEVKTVYPFDIIRNMPVTIDPWAGSFYTEINIEPLIPVQKYSFSEVLPINFSINSYGNAIIDIKNDKKIITWDNIDSSTKIAYYAESPLISPYLFQFGPSFIRYDKGIFYEARPWYLAIDPPSSINIKGTVYNKDGTGAVNGIPISLNDTNSKDYVITKVNAPPSKPGIYSTTIKGSDGDSLIGYAWNETHYGKNITNLVSPTTQLNLIINTTRSSETNVTIILPSNSSVKDTTIPFNVSANITILGADGENCNATINFSNDRIINISEESAPTINMGNLSRSTTINIQWVAKGLKQGYSNITVRAACQSDGIYLEGRDADSVSNITINDTTGPTVNVTFPRNNSKVVGKNLSISYVAEDNEDGIKNCTLYIDDVENQSETIVDKGIIQYFFVFLVVGQHNLQIFCYDNSSNYNMNFSYKHFFNITDYDLLINSSGIMFSNENPAENENITVIANIYNIGTEDITENFTVQLFSKEPTGDIIQIGDNITVQGLNSEKNTSINVSWIAKIGIRDMIINIDAPIISNGSIYEVNESNNVANRSIFIPLWYVYYGDVFSIIILDNHNNKSIFLWANASINYSGNIYIADFDSMISWGDLAAIGKTISGENSTNDFVEIDTALDSSYFNDSINLTYTLNGAPKNFENFSIQGRDIFNISVDNSTNNSNFVTGILWDSSDLAIPEYNGTQDLVFISKIESNLLGKYGVYNYEIKSVGQLKNYLGPDYELYTFYTEIE